MADPVKPGDYGDWLRAKNIDQTQAASVPFDALCPNAITTAFSGSAATALAVAVIAGGAGGGLVTINAPTTTVSNTAETWTAVLVRDPAGGGAGGVSTVTADQGAAGATAWPVAVSGPVAVSAITLPAVSVGSFVATAITAHQGSAGATAWPVAQSGAISVGTLPAVSIGSAIQLAVSAITLPAVSIGTIPAVSIGSAIQFAVSAITLPALSVGTNVSQVVSVSAIPAISVGSIAAVSVSALPAVSVGSFVQPIAVQPRVTGTPLVVSFSMTQSGSTTLGASTAGSRYLVHAYGVFNGDTATHGFALLESNNTTRIPQFCAPNGGGGNIAFPNPLPFATNAAINLTVVGAVGTNAVAGYVELQQVPN